MQDFYYYFKFKDVEEEKFLIFIIVVKFFKSERCFINVLKDVYLFVSLIFLLFENLNYILKGLFVEKENYIKVLIIGQVLM